MAKPGTGGCCLDQSMTCRWHLESPKSKVKWNVNSLCAKCWSSNGLPEGKGIVLKFHKSFCNLRPRPCVQLYIHIYIYIHLNLNIHSHIYVCLCTYMFIDSIRSRDAVGRMGATTIASPATISWLSGSTNNQHGGDHRTVPNVFKKCLLKFIIM